MPQPNSLHKPFTHLHCPDGIPKAVTVLVHGLNNKPSVMLPLARYLNSLGSEVLLVNLTGHTPDSSLSHISTEAWLSDMQQAYAQAYKLSKTGLPKPLYFIGYSLGALVNLYLMSRSPEDMRYDKMVLLAPAAFLRKRVLCLRPVAASLLPAFCKIPSFTPCAYQANRFLTVQVYRILFQMAGAVEKEAYRKISSPVLVIMDAGDEMVSLQKLKTSIATYALHSWKIFLLAKPRGKQAKYAHLFLDEQSAGKENWHDMLEQIRLFLEL